MICHEIREQVVMPAQDCNFNINTYTFENIKEVLRKNHFLPKKDKTLCKNGEPYYVPLELEGDILKINIRNVFFKSTQKIPEIAGIEVYSRPTHYYDEAELAVSVIAELYRKGLATSLTQMQNTVVDTHRNIFSHDLKLDDIAKVLNSVGINMNFQKQTNHAREDGHFIHTKSNSFRVKDRWYEQRSPSIAQTGVQIWSYYARYEESTRRTMNAITSLYHTYLEELERALKNGNY